MALPGAQSQPWRGLTGLQKPPPALNLPKTVPKTIAPIPTSYTQGGVTHPLVQPVGQIANGAVIGQGQWQGALAPGGPAYTPGTGGWTGGDGGAGAAGPGQINIAGYHPDYGALVRGDAGVLQGAANYNDTVGALTSGRMRAIRDAVVRAGFRMGVGGDIDQSTVDQALANTQSTAAQLAQQRQTGSADLQAQLAARGLSFSGAQGAGEQQLQRQYDTATADATDKLNQFIDTTTGNAGTQIADALRQQQALESQTLLRYQTDPRYQPVADQSASYDSASGLYQTPDGRWFNASGVQTAEPDLAQRIAAIMGGYGQATPMATGAAASAAAPVTQAAAAPAWRPTVPTPATRRVVAAMPQHISTSGGYPNAAYARGVYARAPYR